MKRKRLILFFLTLFLLAGGVTYWRLTAEPPSPGEDIAEAALPAAPKDDPKVESDEEKQRRKLLGVWHDDKRGEQIMTMTLNEDGTGTMVVELTGWHALFASKLRLDMKWAFDGKKLSTKTIGGEPADKVNIILNTRDTSGEDTILELTDDRLLLLDKDGKTQYDWRRSKKGKASEK